MIPASRPAITLPTTLPRVASGARCEANGTSTCAATAHIPTMNAAARKVAAEVDRAAPTKPSTAPPIASITSRRFSITSASGTSRIRPVP